MDVLDKAGHDEIDGDDDDSSSCLESQPFEAQQVPWSAAACEIVGMSSDVMPTIREVSEPARVEPLLEPFMVESSPAATITSLKPDPPSEVTNVRCGAIEVNVKAAEMDQDNTISPRSFP